MAWERHGHHRDPAYDRVVLHVVLAADRQTGTLQRADGSALPEVVLLPHLDRSLRAVLRAFHLDPAAAPRCAARWPEVEPAVARDWVRRLGAERLWARARALGHAYGRRPDLDRLLVRRMMRALGYEANAEPFETLASRLPLADLRRADGPTVHAALLAASGLARTDLFDADLPHPMPEAGGEVPPMRPQAWRRGGRPANAPLRRLAQAAAWLAPGGVLRRDPVDDLAQALRDGVDAALARSADAAARRLGTARPHARRPRPGRRRPAGAPARRRAARGARPRGPCARRLPRAPPVPGPRDAPVRRARARAGVGRRGRRASTSSPGRTATRAGAPGAPSAGRCTRRWAGCRIVGETAGGRNRTGPRRYRLSLPTENRRDHRPRPALGDHAPGPHGDPGARRGRPQAVPRPLPRRDALARPAARHRRPVPAAAQGEADPSDAGAALGRDGRRRHRPELPRRGARRAAPHRHARPRRRDRRGRDAPGRGLDQRAVEEQGGRAPGRLPPVARAPAGARRPATTTSSTSRPTPSAGCPRASCSSSRRRGGST